MTTGIIFDLDGTLLDTLEDLKDAVNAALRQSGYPERSLEEVRRFVGNGVGMLVRRAVPEGADPQPVLEQFLAYYGAHCQEKTRPYDGIVDVLAELGERYRLAIVSNKLDSAVKALCADHFPGIYALGEAVGRPRKPAPDMVRKAMDAIGVTDCIYVGDSEVDVATAKKAEVPCISVLWGFRDRQELQEAGAQLFCQEPAELPWIIDRLLDRA